MQGLLHLYAKYIIRELFWQLLALIRHEAASQQIRANHDWLVGSNLDGIRKISI